MLAVLAGISALAAVAGASSVADPVGSAKGVTQRVFGDEIANQFVLSTVPSDPATGHDVYEIDYDASSSKVIVRGNTGVAIASGVYDYMAQYLHASVAWGVNDTGIRFDKPSGSLPVPKASRTVRAYEHSYSWNVCTYGYSAAFWDWARWQKEIDWLALHGVNLPLAFAGQEIVWQKLWLGVGLTEEEVGAWFSGPAFLPWQRMGNIMGWGGPLDQSWIDGQAQMQQSILDRMMSLGMRPVLPGFPGHVPKGLSRVYPDANISSTAPWGGFNSTYTEVPFLEPDDSHFQPLATQFYTLLREEFGKDRDWGGMAYNADQFNEMQPRSSDLTFLADANRAVFEAMVAVDPNATYVMQAWLFHETYWTAERTRAYLSGVPLGRMLILDLNAEESPMWVKFDSFYGHNFIWNALHNYGGRSGMYGNLTRIATGPPSVRTIQSNASIVGTGFTPEAILQNPVYYELVTRMSWEAEAVDADAYVQDWARRRYGSVSASASAAWALMRRTLYDTPWSWTRWSQVELYPKVPQPPRYDLNSTASTEALRLLVAAGASGEVDASSGPYQHDLVDLASQVLAFSFTDDVALLRALYSQLLAADKTAPGPIASIRQAMASTLHHLDDVLATNPSFLLGHWVHEAVTSPNTTTPDQVGNRIFNAKNQVTLWGLGNIHDYASKIWAGLCGDYYAHRWDVFSQMLEDSLASTTPLNATLYREKTFEWELAWDQSHSYPPNAVSGTPALAAVQAVMPLYVDAPASVDAQYTAMPGQDYPGGDVIQAYTRDLDQLKLLCSRTASCLGFNHPGGYIKTSLGTSRPASGSTFYLKKQ